MVQKLYIELDTEADCDESKEKHSRTESQDEYKCNVLFLVHQNKYKLVVPADYIH